MLRANGKFMVYNENMDCGTHVYRSHASIIQTMFKAPSVYSCSRSPSFTSYNLYAGQGYLVKTTLTTRDNSKHKQWRMSQEIFHSQTIAGTVLSYFIFTPLRNHTTVCSLSLFPRNCRNLNFYKMFIVFYFFSAVAGLLFYKCKLLIKLMRKYTSKKIKNILYIY